MLSRTAKDEEIQKIYWDIGEVAQEFNCSTSKVRFWSDFLKLETPRDRANNRKYRKVDFDILRKFYFFVEEEGHTLVGALRKLTQPDGLFEMKKRVETLEKALEEIRTMDSNRSDSMRKIAREALNKPEVI